MTPDTMAACRNQQVTSQDGEGPLTTPSGAFSARLHGPQVSGAERASAVSQPGPASFQCRHDRLGDGMRPLAEPDTGDDDLTRHVDAGVDEVRATWARAVQSDGRRLDPGSGQRGRRRGVEAAGVARCGLAQRSRKDETGRRAEVRLMLVDMEGHRSAGRRQRRSRDPAGEQA